MLKAQKNTAFKNAFYAHKLSQQQNYDLIKPPFQEPFCSQQSEDRMKFLSFSEARGFDPENEISTPL